MPALAPVFPPVDEQLAYLIKGAAELIGEPELRQRLERSRQTGVPLRVKAGFDPTAPDLHLGHTVLLRKLKHFQDLGHEIFFLIGDFTGRIGDPSGRSETRPALTTEQVNANAETYRAQVFQLLDRERTQVVFNSAWMEALPAAEIVRLCSKFTVARMLERDDFHLRFSNNQPISIHEFLYPLVQAYDSVALRADVELGGTDQKFNLLLGREIQREYGQPPQVVLTMPLLEGLDGVRKMSKSLGNYAGIAEPAGTMYAKLMSISDELMWRYWLLLTDRGEADIAALKADVAAGRVHPMQVKKDLAAQVTADFHGAEGARAAGAEFQRVVQRHEAPAELAEVRLQAPAGGAEFRLDKELARHGCAPSVSEAARLIKAGSVSLDGESWRQLTLPSQPARTMLLKVGKRYFATLVIESQPKA
ncbi:MAG TPA: tyrosine--tRNA ligase [Terriglobales bacterium]|jgi:tyrosyl-tRNA synthetase